MLEIKFADLEKYVLELRGQNKTDKNLGRRDRDRGLEGVRQNEGVPERHTQI